MPFLPDFEELQDEFPIGLPVEIKNCLVVVDPGV